MKRKKICILFIITISFCCFSQQWKNYTSSNACLSIAIEKGKIWVGTTGGLLVLDSLGNFQKKYTTVDGLYSNWVNPIVLDNIGNKWLLANQIVTKFDGSNWTVFQYTEQNGLNQVNVIAVDNKNNLWFGSSNGLTKFDGTNWTIFSKINGLGFSPVISLAIDLKGNKWFGTVSDGLYKFDGINWTNYTTSNGLIDNVVKTIAIDKKGNKWFGTNVGVSMFNDTIFTNYTTSNGLSNNYIYTILIDNQNNKWFGTGGGGLSMFNGKVWKTYDNPNIKSPKGGLYINAIAIDSIGTKWLGTDHGFMKFDGINWQVLNFNGPIDNYINAIVIDSLNNKWFGTDQGVTMFDGENWINYTSSNGLADNLIYSIAIDNYGNKWFGTYLGLSKYDGQNWTTFSEIESTFGKNVYSVSVDKNNTIWVGTREGIWGFDGITWKNYYNDYMDIMKTGINSQGNISFQHGDGVFNFDGTAWSFYATTTYGWIPVRLQDIENYNFSWFGTKAGGISSYFEPPLSSQELLEGLADKIISSMSIDDRGNKWFATDKGLIKYDGKTWTTYTTNDGLTSNTINTVASDREGNVWFGTSSGISELIDTSKFLTVLSNFIDFTSIPLNNQIINVRSNVAWKIKCNEDWIHFSPDSGLNFGKLTIIADTNKSFTTRAATIIIESLGFDDIQINVAQYGAVDIKKLNYSTNDIKLFPNPILSNMKLNLNLPPSMNDPHIYIYNSLGAMVKEVRLIGNQIEIGNLNKGLYIISVRDNSRIINRKFVVE